MKYGKGGRKKYAEMGAKYEAKKLPKLRRGNDGQRRLGARRKKQNGGRGRSRSVDAWRRKRRGKGKRKN